MKTNKITFWIPETKQYLVFNLNKEYDEEKVRETIDGYYREYLDPEEAGIEEEMLDELETSSICSWIVDHMYDCGDFEIASIREVNVSDEVAKIIDYLTEMIAENKSYYSRYSCLSTRAEAVAAIRSAQGTLEFIEREVLGV